MRFCNEHYAMVVEAITDHGLEKFAAPGPEQAAERLSSRLEKGLHASNFDPMTDVTLEIASQALRMNLNLTDVDNKNDHQVCPLCYLNRCHEQYCEEQPCSWTFDTWVDVAAGLALERAVSLGLVGQA